MPPLLTTESVLFCPHGGAVQAQPGEPRARAGAPVLRASDGFTVSRCPFSPGTAHPCVSVRWVQAVKRVRQSGDFVLNAASLGLCLAADQAPQGFVVVAGTQGRVAGV